MYITFISFWKCKIIWTKKNLNIILFGYFWLLRLFNFMLLLAILGCCRLFHLKLFLFIIDYFTLNYFWKLKKSNIWLLVVIMLVAIGGYYIVGHYWLFYWWLFYWWLLVAILLMDIGGHYIGGYSVGGYCWLL